MTEPRRYGFRSLRFKFVLASVVVEAAMLTVLVWNSVRITDNAMNETFRNHVETLVPLMNASLAGPLVQRDYATLEERLGRIVHQDSLLYVEVRDELDRIVAKHIGKPERDQLDTTFNMPGTIYDQAFNITMAGQVVGHAHFGLNASLLKATLARLRTQGTTLALVEISLTFLLLATLGYLLTRHLRALALAAQAMQGGNYSVRIDTAGRDEVAMAAYAFNEMAETVQSDIAARKLAEAALRESEAALAAGQQHAKVGSWEFDPATRTGKWSAEMFRLFDCEPEAGVPDFAAFLKFVHPDDHARIIEAEETVMKTGRSASYEYRSHPARGPLKYFDVTVNAILDAAGTVTHLAGTVQNITKRKQAEQALYESEERLRLALNAAHMGIFDWDVPNNHIAWSRRHEELWGFQPGEFDGTYEAFSQRVHPDDVPGINAEIARCITTREPVAREFRVVWPDGSTHWISGRGEFTFGTDGQPLRMLGVAVEVTERKRAERALHESEEHFRTLFEQAPDGIIITDAQRNPLDVNAACCKLLGYTREAMLKLNSVDIVAVEEVPRIDSEIARLKGGSIVRSEWLLRRSDGSVFPAEISAKQLPDGRLQAFLHDITERKRADAEVERLAYNDALTGLPNRVALYGRLGQAIQQVQSPGRALAILLMDLNNFREINDTLGHQVGDQVLVQVADRLRHALWESDVLARLGGDEFAVLLPHLADKAHINLVLNKIFIALRPAFVIDGVPLDVQTAIGIVLYPEHGQDADALLRHADVALYAAKERNHTHLPYSSELDHYNPQQLGLMAELRLALQREELTLHYQPVVDLKSGKTVGVEALVRWQHPGRSLLYPDTFIPAAEKTGLIAPLTTWVLANALRQQHRWHRAGIDLDMSVNLSVRNLQQPDIVVEIKDILLNSGAQPERLTLEITESAIMVDPERAKVVLTELHGLGIRFAIDDFGIGHSSLAYLQQLPVSKLKVDKSFVMDFKNPANAAIVRATVDLAHNLGLSVTAEGVEAEATLDALKLLGCDHVQGYYLNRPQAVDKLVVWLHESPWGLPQKDA